MHKETSSKIFHTYWSRDAQQQLCDIIFCPKWTMSTRLRIRIVLLLHVILRLNQWGFNASTEYYYYYYYGEKKSNNTYVQIIIIYFSNLLFEFNKLYSNKKRRIVCISYWLAYKKLARSNNITYRYNNNELKYYTFGTIAPLVDPERARMLWQRSIYSQSDQQFKQWGIYFNRKHDFPPSKEQ